MSQLKDKKNQNIREIVIKNPENDINQVDENVLNSMIAEAQKETISQSTLPSLDDDKLFKKKNQPQKVEQIEQKPAEINKKINKTVHFEPKKNDQNEHEIHSDDIKDIVEEKPKKKKKQKRRPLSEAHKIALAKGRAKALANRRAKAKAKKDAKMQKRINALNATKNTVEKDISKVQEYIKNPVKPQYMPQSHFFELMDKYNEYKSTKNKQIEQKQIKIKQKPKVVQPVQPQKNYSKYDIYFDSATQIQSGIYGKRRKPRHF